MKKLFLVLAFSFWLLAFGYNTVFAQREVSDYQYQYEKYRDFYKNYLKARDTYLKYQTLTSQDELIKASQDFLFSRSIVIRTYLQALKYQLGETADVVADQKRDLTLALDKEVSWLTDNENQLREFQSPALNDLLEVSLRVEGKENLFKKLAYQTLSNIILGKMRSLYSEITAINFLLEDKINKNSQGKDITILNQWLQAVKDKAYQSQKNIEKAEDYLTALNKTTKGKDAFDYYQKIQEELEKARVSLLGAVDFQKEILREVEND